MKSRVLRGPKFKSERELLEWEKSLLASGKDLFVRPIHPDYIAQHLTELNSRISALEAP